MDVLRDALFEKKMLFRFNLHQPTDYYIRKFHPKNPAIMLTDNHVTQG